MQYTSSAQSFAENDPFKVYISRDVFSTVPREKFEPTSISSYFAICDQWRSSAHDFCCTQSVESISVVIFCFAAHLLVICYRRNMAEILFSLVRSEQKKSSKRADPNKNEFYAPNTSQKWYDTLETLKYAAITSFAKFNFDFMTNNYCLVGKSRIVDIPSLKLLELFDAAKCCNPLPPQCVIRYCGAIVMQNNDRWYVFCDQWKVSLHK